ncbi:MAG: DUF4340 domain-containing protein [Oscillospiraceae bacterium]|nr:DUF4340 domain-containing protein [Oscillospiraceae bacterium]
MKRGAKLGVLVAALAVLVGAWGLINYLTTQKEAADAALEITDDDIDLAVGEYDDVTALSWTYSESTVNLTYDADSETWVNADDETCPIDQEAVDALVTAVSSTCASQEVTDVEDFEQYGLDEPTLTVTASTADSTVTYAVGSTSLTGEYYVRVDGSTSVYTETGLLAGAFQVQIDDLLQLESAPTDIASVVSLSVETDVTSYTVEYIEDATDIYYTDAYTWFLTTLDGVDYTAVETVAEETAAEVEVEDEADAETEAEGEDASQEAEAVAATTTTAVTALDADSVATLYELVSGISFLSCETWNAEDLSAYGLDDPQGVVTLTYLDSEDETQTFTLEFGDYTSGYVYVRLAGSNMVYLADGSILDGLMYPDWTSMTPLTLTPLDWDTVTTIAVTLDGDMVYEIERTYTIEMVEVEVETEDEEDTEESEDAEDADAEESEEVETELVETQVNSYTWGDKSLDADDMDGWLDDVYALTAASLADTEEGRSEVMTITFQRDADVWQEVTVTFWKYSSTQYLCQLNGETYFLVSSSTVDGLYDDIWEILTAEDEDEATEENADVEADAEADAETEAES